MIFVDTSAWYASVCADDSNHLAAKQFLNSSPVLVTTELVANEVVTLLRARGRSERAYRLGERIFSETHVSLFWTQKQTILKTWEVFCEFKDKHWSFVDCSSKVVMQQLQISTAFAFDHHFRQFGSVEVVP